MHMNLFTTLFKKEQYKSNRENPYYKRLFNRQSDGQFYRDLLKSIEQPNREIMIPRAVDIICNNKFPITQKDVKRECGKPKQTIKYDNIPDVDVLFYKQCMGGHKTKIEYHFFKNQLFFYGYIFSYVDKKQVQEIRTIIKEKYRVDEDISENDVKLIDEFGNVIQLKWDVYFTVQYFLGKTQSLRKVVQSWKDTTPAREQVNSSRRLLLNRL